MIGKQGFESLKVVFAPYYDSNPYQSLLSDALARLGATVTGAGAKELFNVVRDVKPDVVHLHWLHALYMRSGVLRTYRDAALLPLRLHGCRSRGAAIFWTAHNISDHEGRFPWLDRRLRRWMLGFSDGVFVHSRAAEQQLASECGAQAGRKICVIQHGNYLGSYENKIGRAAARQELGIADECFLFLFLGYIRSYKGLTTLVETFRRLPRSKPAILMIAGRPIMGTSVEGIRRATCGDSRVAILPEFVPPQRVQVFMNAADAVVLPYTDADSSGALILAMSFGKTVIMPSFPWALETVPEGGALLYEPGRDDLLLEAMGEAIRRHRELPAMGSLCLRKVSEMSWSDAAAATMRAYEKALGNTGPPSCTA